jgi:hypothetical protein
MGQPYADRSLPFHFLDTSICRNAIVSQLVISNWLRQRVHRPESSVDWSSVRRGATEGHKQTPTPPLDPVPTLPTAGMQ